MIKFITTLIYIGYYCAGGVDTVSPTVVVAEAEGTSISTTTIVVAAHNPIAERVHEVGVI